MKEDYKVDPLSIKFDQTKKDTRRDAWDRDYMGYYYLKEEPKSKKQILLGRVFYNHNYGVISKGKDILNFKIPNYEYCSCSISKQIVGFQFHPEKSQITGQILIEMIY